MKKILPLGINAYEFDELSETAKDKAIDDHIDFMLDVMQYNSENKGNYEKAIDKAESMQTPWFTKCYILDYCKDEIIDEIKANEYLFYEDGEIVWLTYKRNNENKTEKVWFNFNPKCAVEVTVV